jgi:hypothetical protein
VTSVALLNFTDALPTTRMIPSAAKHMLDLRTRRERELERRMAGATPWDRLAARVELRMADALTMGRLEV